MKNDLNLVSISNIQILGAYGCDAYGANAYSAACTTSTGTDTGGGLADTGYNILLPLALAAALIIAAVILIVKRIRRRAANHS